MTRPLRILLADDHQMFRDALRGLLASLPNVEVVAETDNGLDVVELAKAASPDIVCMDLGLPGMNGIEATRSLATACPAVKVIVVSAFVEKRYVLDAFDAGAVAYVTKIDAGNELLRAVEAVQCNQKYLSPRVATLLEGKLSEPPNIAQLGTREGRVLQLIGEGHTPAQIAELLQTSRSTVDVYLRNIMRKLDLPSIAALTRFAVDAAASLGADAEL